MKGGPINKEKAGNAQVHQVHLAICSACKKWKQKTEIMHSFSKFRFVNMIYQWTFMHYYGSMMCSEKKIKKQKHCKPPATVY